MKSIKLFLAALLFATSFAVAQQTADITKESGYFDFSLFSDFKNAELITEVFLEEPMLKMVAKMAEGKKGEMEELIGALKLVKVNEFKIDEKELSKTESSLESMDKSFKSKNWDRIIRTKNQKSFINVYVKKGNSDGFVGMAITSMENKGKLTLVNIVGDIDLATIGKISSQFNLPKFDQGDKDK